VLEAGQRRGVGELRERRDGAAVEAALRALEDGARGTENLMPLLLDAVRSMATLGEISDTLRRTWGTWAPRG
jgi:methylmalonyl-CoA mutase N-terminal domain/subunit